jgi:hypothetical protein
MATIAGNRKGTVVYTTGILRKSPRTRYALVDAVNLGPTSRNITVQVIDWSSGSPVPLKVVPCGKKRCTQTVGPNKSVFLYADVSKVQFKYEVRIIQPVNCRFVTNVFGVTQMTFKPLEGGTVLQHDLVKIGK